MVKDHYDALQFTLKQAISKTPVSVELIQQLNAHVMKFTGSIYRTLLGDVNAAKGEYRKCNVSAGEHYFVSYDKVPPLTKQLTDTVSIQLEHVETAEENLELAFRTHYELVTIHPFYDGNGRTSRLLMNFLLERSGLPLCILYKEDKAIYYEVLQKSQQQGNQQPFFDFMYQQYEKHLQDEIKKAQELIVKEPKKERGL